MITQRDARDCLESICKLSSGLSDAELIFVERLVFAEGRCFSNDEKAAIMELYDKVVL